MSRARQLDREIKQVLGRHRTGYRVGRKIRRERSRFVLAFRKIGGDGDPWPAWLRAYKSACGTYVIKESGRVVYVGSSRSRLYDTITRHFQQWKRTEKYWKGRYGAGHDPGLTYRRGRCEIAVQVVSCGQELTEEARLIGRLKPRDNLTEHPDGGDEEVPF